MEGSRAGGWFGHDFKYRLAYVVDGVCVVRYDNEAGKGDHRHFGERESNYTFQTPEKLLPTLNATLRGGTVKTVTLDVRAPSEAMADFVRVWKAGKAEKICAHQLRHTGASLESTDG